MSCRSTLLALSALLALASAQCGHRGDRYPGRACPAPTTDANPVLLNDSSVAFSCPSASRVPTLIVDAPAAFFFQCCFDGYANILWEYSPTSEAGPFGDISCRSRFDNSTVLIYAKSDGIYSGFYRCTAIGADGRRAHSVQRLVVQRQLPPEMKVKVPTFLPGCRRPPPLLLRKGQTVPRVCRLKVPLEPQTNLSVRVFVNGELAISCLYRPFCDRLNATTKVSNISGAVCKSRGGHQFRLGLSVDVNDGTPLVVTVSALFGPPANVSVVVADLSSPSAPGDVWFFETRPLFSINTLLWSLVSAALLVVCFVFSVVGFWAFSFNVRLAYRRVKFSELMKIPAHVVVISCPDDDSESLQVADRLSDYLTDRPDDRYHVHTPPAGQNVTTMAGSLGADSSHIILVVLDTHALRSELFAGQMNSLLQRESTRRVYLLLDTFSRMRRRLRDVEESPENVASDDDGEESGPGNLLRRIKADARLSDCVRWRRRPWWWVRWQVRTCLDLAQLCKPESDPRDLSVMSDATTQSSLGSSSESVSQNLRHS